jgi:hypothetical protein
MYGIQGIQVINDKQLLQPLNNSIKNQTQLMQGNKDTDSKESSKVDQKLTSYAFPLLVSLM